MHAQKEEEKYRKMFEALDTDTHAIAVQNNASERTVTSSNAESSAQAHDSARAVTEREKSSSKIISDSKYLFLIEFVTFFIALQG